MKRASYEGREAEVLRIRAWGPWAHSSAARPCWSPQGTRASWILTGYQLGCNCGHEERHVGNHCVCKSLWEGGRWDQNVGLTSGSAFATKDSMVGVERPQECGFTTSLPHRGSCTGWDSLGALQLLIPGSPSESQ